MRKYENFCKSLNVLRSVDFKLADDDEIYRMGIIGQFNLTFELAWKALQATLRRYAVPEAETSSPREILKRGYQTGFLGEADVWLLMLKKRNLAVHVYDEEEVDERVVLIRDSFLPVLEKLEQILGEKNGEIERDSWD
ncbi:MAG: nucleotidyltransferase [Lachnospiraceae bacterium]|nr:nucleotidyltransferase [Lachnospiraceae bacterium]